MLQLRRNTPVALHERAHGSLHLRWHGVPGRQGRERWRESGQIQLVADHTQLRLLEELVDGLSERLGSDPETVAERSAREGAVGEGRSDAFGQRVRVDDEARWLFGDAQVKVGGGMVRAVLGRE
ncbi:MAG: hypothetical protein ABMA64_37335 [Myxococcota bacterium]